MLDHDNHHPVSRMLDI